MISAATATQDQCWAGIRETVRAIGPTMCEELLVACEKLMTCNHWDLRAIGALAMTAIHEGQCRLMAEIADEAGGHNVHSSG